MTMIFYIYIFILTIMGIIIIRFNAEAFGLVDIPNERSMHEKSVPRGAGIAFVLSVFLVLFFLNYEYLEKYYYIYVAIFITFVAGVWDDVREVSPKVKFIFMFISAVILYMNGFYITNIGTYFGMSMVLPSLLIFPFTFFALAGYTNALNLMDGLDGLASSLSIIILSAFYIIGWQNNDELLMTLSSSFIITLIAFLLFNWNPAKIFMGDSGSLTLGMVIVILAIQSIQYITPASVLFIIALPILDTFIVITRRIQRGQSPFKADKNHMHHILYGMKGDIRYTVVVLTMMQVVFSIIGYQVKGSDDFISLILFGLLFVMYFNLFDQRVKRRSKTD